MHWAWIDNYGVEATMRLRFCHCDATKRHQHHCHYFFFIVIIIFLNYVFVNKIAVASSLMYWLFGSPYTIYNRANREK